MEDHTKLTEQERKLIAGYLSGNLSPEEKKALTEWINKNPDQNKGILRHYTILWQVSSTLGNKGKNVAAKAKRIIERRIKAKGRPGRILHSGFFTPFLKAVALLVLAFTTVIFAFYMLTGRLLKEEKKIITLSAPVGTLSDVILDDGTRVWLNSGSSLKHDSEFRRKNRVIELEGEAFFKWKNLLTIPYMLELARLM